MRRRVLPAVLCGLLLTACRVDVDVATRVNDDGSGVVEVTATLDQEAADRVPDLAEQLRVEDLEATGWTVTGPEPTEDGGVLIQASKPFADPDQAAAILAEVGGEEGIFQGIELSRDRSIGRTEFSLDGTMDLSNGLDAFSDPAMTEILGEPLGFDVAELREELGQPVAETVGFTFTLDLPVEDVDAPDAEVTSEGGRSTAVWTAVLAQEPVSLVADATEWDLAVLGFVAGAALAALVLLVVLIRRRRQRRRSIFREP